MAAPDVLEMLGCDFVLVDDRVFIAALDLLGMSVFFLNFAWPEGRVFIGEVLGMSACSVCLFLDFAW